MKILLIFFLLKAKKQVHKSSRYVQLYAKIFNLLSKKKKKKKNETENLNAYEHISLKGLKFTPTPEIRNVQEIKTDI